MLSEILKLKEVTKLDKTAKQSINGGYYCRTDIRCSTIQDCWEAGADRCHEGYCHIY
ncbi:hypothetical protein [Aquimarina sp. 2201CG14-23]|uniref:hypothetical protein n=1 Tax=Aquimarina mycalae TaxID=3040073 RepID=UPI00247804E6|nr:hypothetical protein [Aquimarina sp. 2201CG14-23]MDH7447465.1 hypothetical protein [Aquimarina sp. 2201CG14-23]